MEYDKENVDSGPLFAYDSGTPCVSLIAATHQIMIRAKRHHRGRDITAPVHYEIVDRGCANRRHAEDEGVHRPSGERNL